MKKTYVTNMPNHIGAFLKASKCFSDLGINITRVSYNKAVDSHTLFIEVDGEEDSIRKADERLKAIGYLSNEIENGEIILIEFKLPDIPGSVTAVLELINEFNFNISYISSAQNGSEYQYFKMGLYVSEQERLNGFLARVEELCEVRVIDYNHGERVYDNSLFYKSYVKSLSSLAGLGKTASDELMVNVNLAMQTLDEKGLSPYKTFDSIQRFAQMIAESKGERFLPRVSEHCISDRTRVILIEPDCGSNTTIIESDGERLFVDTGYACYRKEMMALLRKLVPDFKRKKERVFITHADVDHCGLLSEFDEVIASKNTIRSLQDEWRGLGGARERNPIHKPYASICKILTEYKATDERLFCSIGESPKFNSVLAQIGTFTVGELCFEVYEGKGGHLTGETILIDYDHKLAFTGDVYVNMHDLTPKQAEYNKYAPILMTSVDTDVTLAKKVREAVISRLGQGEWNIFGGHGNKKLHTTKTLS